MKKNMEHVIQVSYIDVYGCKRILDRVKTTKTLQEYLETRGKFCGFYQWNYSKKQFELDPKCHIEELPIIS